MDKYEIMHELVSTHSRTEAAAIYHKHKLFLYACFNTQPHGGGCLPVLMPFLSYPTVSTHSRTEAAASRFNR